MSEQRPSVGRIVHYTLSDQDAEVINRRRAEAGTVANMAAADQIYPAVVVRTFGINSVNLQVLLDGTDTYWATSRQEGEPGVRGRWIWPPRV